MQLILIAAAVVDWDAVSLISGCTALTVVTVVVVVVAVVICI